MSRLRAFVLTILISIILAAVVESNRINRRVPVPDAFDAPFRVVGKRNQFYGLFKKLNYDSPKPVYYMDGFGMHHR